MSQRKKFKIMYPADYWDKEKAGKPYLPGEHTFVVMSEGGVFFQVYMGPYDHSVVKRSDVLRKYDVVWK